MYGGGTFGMMRLHRKLHRFHWRHKAAAAPSLFARKRQAAWMGLNDRAKIGMPEVWGSLGHVSRFWIKLFTLCKVKVSFTQIHLAWGDLPLKSFLFSLKSLILLICEFSAILEKFPCRTCLEFLARVLKQSWRRLETAGFWWANQGSMPHVLARVRCTWACLMMLLISTQKTSQVQSWKMMKWIDFRFPIPIGRWTPWKRPCSKPSGVQMSLTGSRELDVRRSWFKVWSSTGARSSRAVIRVKVLEHINNFRFPELFRYIITKSGPSCLSSNHVKSTKTLEVARGEGMKGCGVSVEDQQENSMAQCTTKSLYHRFSSQKISESKWNFTDISDAMECNNLPDISTDVCPELETVWSFPQSEISGTSPPVRRIEVPTGALCEQWRACQRFPSPVISSMSIRIIRIYLRLRLLQQRIPWRSVRSRSPNMVDRVPKWFRSLVLSSGSFTTKANANHVCTTAKEDAGMGMNVAFVISAQQNRSGRGRVDNITWRELSEENENVPKHKDHCQRIKSQKITTFFVTFVLSWLVINCHVSSCFHATFWRLLASPV